MNPYSDIQVSILTRLLKSNGLKFSQAFPVEENIDSDLYNYHLQYLVKRGLVVKEDGLYKLSSQGHYAVQFFDSQGNYFPQFRLSVLIFVLDKNNNILLQQRTRHPCMGDIGVPSGKIKPGESTVDAASRKLFEETGLLSNLEFVGTIRSIRKNQNGDLIENPIFNVVLGSNPTGELLGRTEYGLNFWASLEKAVEYQKENLAFNPSHVQIFEKLKTDESISNFSIEETITIKGY